MAATPSVLAAVAIGIGINCCHHPSDAAYPATDLAAEGAGLGIRFLKSETLPAGYERTALVALHGSWNRTPLSGYKVVFVPFDQGKPSGPIETVLDGFALSRDYQIDYPASVLTLAIGDTVEIAGAVYQVRNVRAIGDGSERRAALTHLVPPV